MGGVTDPNNGCARQLVCEVINYLPCSYDEEEECVNQYECQPLESLEKIEIGTLYFCCPQ